MKNAEEIIKEKRWEVEYVTRVSDRLYVHLEKAETLFTTLNFSLSLSLFLSHFTAGHTEVGTQFIAWGTQEHVNGKGFSKT